MKDIIDNFNSKKLAAFAGVVAGILNAGGSAELTIAGLVGALAAFTIPQAFADRGRQAAIAAIGGLDAGREAQGDSK
jgi:hypothetical protein